jgi:hypothetical protein
VVTQAAALSDKSRIGEATEGGLEGLEGAVTLLAVLLTLYWSFLEHRASEERCVCGGGGVG